MILNNGVVWYESATIKKVKCHNHDTSKNPETCINSDEMAISVKGVSILYLYCEVHKEDFNVRFSIGA